MALIWMDGFDNYQNSSYNRFTGIGTYYGPDDLGWNSSPRFRGRSLALGLGHYVWKDVSAGSDSIITGMAYYHEPDPTYPGWIEWRIGTASQEYIKVYHDYANQRFNITGVGISGTQYTATGTSKNYLWQYIEIKYIVGVIAEVRVDEQVVFTTTLTDSGSNGPTPLTRIFFGQPGNFFPRSRTTLDDWYVCDGSGTKNNDYLGDTTIHTYYPNGNGSSSQLTGIDNNNVNNYNQVNEFGGDGDSSYVFSSTTNDKDLYQIQNLVVNPTSIHGIQKTSVIKKTGSGTKTFSHVIKSGSTETTSPAVSTTTQYAAYTSPILEDDPNTGAPWDKAGFDLIETGIKIN